MKVVSIEKYKEYDSFVTLEMQGFFGGALGRPPKIYRVVGDCTVWNWYPSGRSVGTLMSRDIYDAIKAYEFRQHAKEHD